MGASCIVPLLACLVVAQAPQAPAAAPAVESPDAPAEKPRVLVLDLEVSDIEQSQARLINGLVTDSMSRFHEFDVVSSADLRQLVAVEADKAAAGCDASSCLAEVAGALGARFVVFGNVGRLGELTVVTLSLFDTQKAKAEERRRVQVKNIEELPDAIDDALAGLMGQPAVARAPSTPASPPPGAGPPPLLVVAGVGAAVGVVGAVSLGAWALLLDSTLADPSGPAGPKDAALEQGPWVAGGAIAFAVVTLAAGGLAIATLVME